MTAEEYVRSKAESMAPKDRYLYAVARNDEPAPGPAALFYIRHLEETIEKMNSDKSWEIYAKRCEALGINP